MDVDVCGAFVDGVEVLYGETQRSVDEEAYSACCVGVTRACIDVVFVLSCP